jgi:hypothetical protein
MAADDFEIVNLVKVKGKHEKLPLPAFASFSSPVGFNLNRNYVNLKTPRFPTLLVRYNKAKEREG